MKRNDFYVPLVFCDANFSRMSFVDVLEEMIIPANISSFSFVSVLRPLLTIS